MFYFGLAKVRRFFIFHSVFDKGINRENIGEYPKALSYLYLALSLMPRSIKTYIAIARVNRKHKTFLNGIDFINKAINKFPKNGILYAIKGDLYRKIKEYETAISCYDDAIKFEYLNTDYLETHAKIKYLLGDTQSAIYDYNKAIQINNQNPEFYKTRGFYHFEKKNYDCAIEDYSKAIQLNQNDVHSYFMRGALKEIKCLNKEADEDFAKAKELGIK